MNIPLKLVKGDSFTWKDSNTSDNLGNPLDSSAFTLKYAIRGAVVLDLTATPDGKGWSTSITTTQSNTLTAGNYFWQAYVIDDPVSPTQRITLAEGQIEILNNVATASAGFDGRSQLQKDVDAIDAAITAMAAGNGVQAYSIGNRNLQKMQITDLIKLRSHLKYRLNLEQRADKIKNGLGDPGTLAVRFK